MKKRSYRKQSEAQAAFAFGTTKPEKEINETHTVSRVRKADQPALPDARLQASKKIIVPTGFEAPRWENGPLICKRANLPAFNTWDDAKKFLAETMGEALLKWECPACKAWHVWPKPYAPAGSSSGTSRAYTIPQHIIKLFDEAEAKSKN